VTCPVLLPRCTILVACILALVVVEHLGVAHGRPGDR
jgi:hypothetical protein